jgi:hypothetical protein
MVKWGKYILNSPAEKAKPIDRMLYKKFTSNKANATWLKSIAYEVKPDSPLPPTPVVDAAKMKCGIPQFYSLDLLKYIFAPAAINARRKGPSRNVKTNVNATMSSFVT